jgi:hypothetical protein
MQAEWRCTPVLCVTRCDMPPWWQYKAKGIEAVQEGHVCSTRRAFEQYRRVLSAVQETVLAVHKGHMAPIQPWFAQQPLHNASSHVSRVFMCMCL